MAKFEIDGITLRIPENCLTPPLVKALENGNYEHTETAALKRHVRADDRVLDLGAGAGFVSAQAARIVGGANVTSVEASPDMLEVLRRNLDENGARDATILNGAVVADTHDGDDVKFAVRDAFWASSISDNEREAAHRLHAVPALRLSDLIDAHRPSIIVMDVEGAEASLCLQPLADCVRILIMEIHTRQYDATVLKKMFDGLSASGMTYMPWGTRGEVVVFQRVAPET